MMDAITAIVATWFGALLLMLFALGVMMLCQPFTKNGKAIRKMEREWRK